MAIFDFDRKLSYIDFMIKDKILHLSDWFTDDELGFASKLTSDNDCTLHDHNFYEIFYITKGSIGYQLNGVNSTLHTGDLSFINIGDTHIFFRNKDTECEHRDIIIRPALFKELCDSLSPNFIDELTKNKNFVINLSANKIKELEYKSVSIDRLSISNKKSAKIKAKLLCFELLEFLFNSNLSHPTSNAPKWMNELMDRFNDTNILKGGIPEIIKPFYYTNEHICRVFKKYNGITMTGYLNQRRLFEFANMLFYTNLSISELYEQLGINSISYFNQLFKKQYHATPLQFRKQKEMRSYR